MKILCLVDKYYPSSSANTVCCNNLTDYFKRQGASVDYLAIKDSIDDVDYAQINGSNIFKIDTYHDKYLKKYGKKYNAKKWIDLPWLLRKYLGLINKVRCCTRPSTGYVSLDCVDYKKIYNQVAKISNKYDAIISFSMPFGLHIVAKKLLEMGLADNWHPVFLDVFEYNKCLDVARTNYRKKLTQKTLKPATAVFLAEGILKEHLEMGYTPDYHKKAQEFYIPTLKDLKLENNAQDDENNIIMTYAGLFYKDIRRPDEMLDILSSFPQNFKLHIYGDGCEKDVEEKAQKFKENQIFRHGRVTHDKCLEELSKSNILINVGNTITNQMPSKVFEYISIGKPIINFYFTEDDMCLPIFKKYELAFNLNLNNYTDSDIENLIEFCNKFKNKKLSYEDATKNLVEYRVDFIADKMYSTIKK